MTLTSCQKVIELDVPNSPQQLVVEGTFTNETTVQTVRLSYTSPYFDENETPRVSNALVVIEDEFGPVDTLTEVSVGSGEYVTDSSGIVGHTYTLYIKTLKNKEYRSTPEELKAVSPITSIQYHQVDSSGSLVEGYYVTIDTFDPPGIGNLYRWVYRVNDKPRLHPLDMALMEDKYFDGNILENFTVNQGQRIEGNPVDLDDVVLVRQSSISRPYFDFLLQYMSVTGLVGSSFDPPPAAIEGNIRNIHDPNDVALGYFGASGVSVAMIEIK